MRTSSSRIHTTCGGNRKLHLHAADISPGTVKVSSISKCAQNDCLYQLVRHAPHDLQMTSQAALCCGEIPYSRVSWAAALKQTSIERVAARLARNTPSMAGANGAPITHPYCRTLHIFRASSGFSGMTGTLLPRHSQDFGRRSNVNSGRWAACPPPAPLPHANGVATKPVPPHPPPSSLATRRYPAHPSRNA